MVAIRIQRFVAQATYDDVSAPFEDTSSQIGTRWTTPIRLRQLARPIETRRQSSQSQSGMQTRIPLEQALTEVGPMHQNPDANHNE